MDAPNFVFNTAVLPWTSTHAPNCLTETLQHRIKPPAQGWSQSQLASATLMQTCAQAQALGEPWHMTGGEEARTEPACPLACGMGNVGPLAGSSSSALQSREPEFRDVSQGPSWKDLLCCGARYHGAWRHKPLEIQKFRVREYQWAALDYHLGW